MGFSRAEIQKQIGLLEEEVISIWGGGGLTILKGTLSSLPIYFMSLFSISRRVRVRLEKDQRDFLWDSHLEVRKNASSEMWHCL